MEFLRTTPGVAATGVFFSGVTSLSCLAGPLSYSNLTYKSIHGQAGVESVDVVAELPMVLFPCGFSHATYSSPVEIHLAFLREFANK